jgi:hypothetical protein
MTTEAEQRLTEVAHAAVNATVRELLEKMGPGAMAGRSGDSLAVTSIAILRGLRAVETAAHVQAQLFCPEARQAGLSWEQIGKALGVAPDTARRESADAVANQGPVAGPAAARPQAGA